MKSYFCKSLMTEGFKTFYFQPLTLQRLLDFTILRTDILSSRTKTEGLDFQFLYIWRYMYNLNGKDSLAPSPEMFSNFSSLFVSLFSLHANRAFVRHLLLHLFVTSEVAKTQRDLNIFYSNFYIQMPLFTYLICTLRIGLKGTL